MLGKYEDLNYATKEFFTEELNKLFHKELDKQLLERCYIEMNMLYEKSIIMKMHLPKLYQRFYIFQEEVKQ